jgi:hypothetical protein
MADDNVINKGKIVIESIEGQEVKGKIQYPDDALRKLKAEVSRKASMANKRLKRLEKNNLTNLPAYQQWVDYKGGVKFSVKGKDYNQLQQELARVNQFLNNKTSLVRQANKYLKDIAEITGIQYKSVKELPAKTKTFFELASKVEQYLRNVEGSASAIGYQKIWQVINEYVEDEKIELDSSKMDMEKVLDEVIELAKYDVKDGNVEFDFEGWINVNKK